MTRHLMRSSPTPRAGPVRAGARLPCRVTLTDGRVFDGPLTPERHRAIQLGMLHAESDGLVELTPGTRANDGNLAVDRRARAEHYLPGGAGGHPGWLPALLAHAERIITGAYARDRTGPAREEAFVGVASRTRARGAKDAVAATRWLWVDVDCPDRLDALWALLAERPCHLLVESGGSGGAHAHWKLDTPLDARIAGPDGRVIEPIERAHERLIHALGVDAHGRPDVADPPLRRSLARHAPGRHGQPQVRRLGADHSGRPAAAGVSAGGAHGRPAGTAVRHQRAAPAAHRGAEPGIHTSAYFARLAGIDVPANGLVRCPVSGHDDAHPSCSVGRDPEAGWCCHSASCGARGAIYDLASVLIGGPWGPRLRGEAFTRAHSRVAAAFGERGPTGAAHAARPALAATDTSATTREMSPELWVVRVHDDVDARIAGHPGLAYASPPQVRDTALALISLLLGGPLDDTDRSSWTHPVAGGRRTIALERTQPPDRLPRP